jgi:hypothetical protein
MSDDVWVHVQPVNNCSSLMSFVKSSTNSQQIEVLQKDLFSFNDSQCSGVCSASDAEIQKAEQFTQAAQARFDVCAVMTRFAGTWNTLDSQGRVVAQVTFGSCQAHHLESMSKFDKEFEGRFKEWDGATPASAAIVAGDIYGSGKVDLRISLGNRADAIMARMWSTTGLVGDVSPDATLLGAKVSGSRLCFDKLVVGATLAEFSYALNAVSKSATPKCMVKASRELKESEFYVDAQYKKAALKRQCMSPCETELKQCKREWNNHPSCTANYNTCAARCP